MKGESRAATAMTGRVRRRDARLHPSEARACSRMGGPRELEHPLGGITRGSATRSSHRHERPHGAGRPTGHPRPCSAPLGTLSEAWVGGKHLAGLLSRAAGRMRGSAETCRSVNCLGRAG